jgi:hypothetical protein
LCCSNPPKSQITYLGFLCYADDAACENYVEAPKHTDLNHVRIKLRPDTMGMWDSAESYPLHTGRHSQ